MLKREAVNYGVFPIYLFIVTRDSTFNTEFYHFMFYFIKQNNLIKI